MFTLFDDISPYDQHSVTVCDNMKDTAVFETAVTVQNNHEIVRYRVWLSSWKGNQNRLRNGAKTKSYMMDAVAPADWTVDKVHNTILVYLAGIKWLRVSRGIQWLHADYQPQIHDSI